MQNIFDKEDMEEYVYGYVNDAPYFEEQFQVKLEEALVEDNLFEMGNVMRGLIDNHGMCWEYARGEALNDWCRGYREKEVI